MKTDGDQSFSTELAGWLKQQQQTGKAWMEFFEADSASMGVYTVPAGTDDWETHNPHAYDEVYFAVSGRGTLHVDGMPVAVTSHSVHFVPAGVPHFFCDVAEDLVLFVVFAKAPGKSADG